MTSGTDGPVTGRLRRERAERDRYRDGSAVGLPDPDDEHVVAAARNAGAQVIVTFNLNDFPAKTLEAFDLEALHPDDFLLDLIDLHPLQIASLVRDQAAALRQPPMTYEAVLERLSVSVPESVGRLRER